MENRIKALAQFLSISEDDITESYENNFEADGAEYMVLNDLEADIACDDYLDNYLQDCILNQIPENLRNYFDQESFKDDCIHSDGRGHILSGYDGEENEQTVDGETFYIYRVN
jgi:hypothetical protein